MKVTESEICVFILSTTFVSKVSHSKNKWERCGQKVYWSLCKVPVILVIF